MSLDGEEEYDDDGCSIGFIQIHIHIQFNPVNTWDRREREELI